MMVSMLGKLAVLISKHSWLSGILLGSGLCERDVEIGWLTFLPNENQADREQSVLLAKG